MDQKEFEEKLSLVAEWEWRRVQGTAGPSARNLEDGENPMELVVTKLKDRPCEFHKDRANCYFNIKPYDYGKETLVVQRCKCGTAITPKGNVIENIPPNIGATASMVDRGIKTDGVIRFANGTTPQPSQFKVNSNVSQEIASQFEDDTGIITRYHD